MSLFDAFLQTSLNVATAYAHVPSTSHKGKKKGPGCTPCAVNARIMDAKARAGFSPAPQGGKK